MVRIFSLILVCAMLPAFQVGAASPDRVSLQFKVSTNAGIGKSMYVVGNHRDLGEWTATNAVKMEADASGTNWSLNLSVQGGQSLEYKFVRRNNNSGGHCDVTNIEWTAGANLTTSTPFLAQAPYPGKTVYYFTSWTNAFILFSIDGVLFQDQALDRIGAGRSVGEFLYRGAGFAVEGEPVEFVMHGFTPGGVEQYDNAPYEGFGSGNYQTPLDVFVLQDGQVFNYWPPAATTPSRIETVFVNSAWAPTIPSRNIRIYLPRNYDVNVSNRYPVLYMHDGQNVFRPGGAFGTWAAEFSADREISQGRMRETIIVGVDNTSERMREYIPPGDDVGSGPGTGDRYADFLIHNVRPTLDFNYRTLSDRANTMVLGSSLGGLISAYLGLETNAYGCVGPVSPSFWAAPNFVSRILSNNTRGIRIYMDMGTAESDSSMWNPTWNAYGLFLDDGYSIHGDLEMVVGCGHGHNEPSWSNRLHRAFRYMLGIQQEPNPLALAEYPVEIQSAAVPSGVFTQQVSSMRGFTYYPEQADKVTGQVVWVRGAGVGETNFWSTLPVPVTNAFPASTTLFIRVRGLSNNR